MNRIREELFYRELRNSPRPQYPFADRISPHIEQLVQEYYQWIDADGGFESGRAREKHKRHRLTDIAARAFPSQTLDELRPVARFTAFLAILDDFMDRTGQDELATVENKITALCTGDDPVEPAPGFYHQMYLMRQDALACGMPQHLYQQYIDSIVALMKGYGEEKKYNAAGKPPPLETFKAIRRKTSGGVCYAKYLCMQETYRGLPDTVLQHPSILRLHDLSGDLIGYHNDFISLPKELARDGDVINLVISVQREYSLGLHQACSKALEIHNQALNEFIQLQNSLPDFGSEWQHIAQAYVQDLGVMIQGVYKWHTDASGRYVPGAYVEPEHQALPISVPTKVLPSTASTSSSSKPDINTPLMDTESRRCKCIDMQSSQMAVSRFLGFIVLFSFVSGAGLYAQLGGYLMTNASHDQHW